MNAELSDSLRALWGRDPPVIWPSGVIICEALELRYAIRLPEDFRAYLAESAPVSEWADDGGILYWEPPRIASVKDERTGWSHFTPHGSDIDAKGAEYLVFADFMGWCGYGYAICCSDGPDRGKVAMITTDSGSGDRFVASSFRSFLRLAAEDSPRLHSSAGDHYTDII
jgi:hypothetical protein